MQLTVALSHTAWFPLIAAAYCHLATAAFLLSHKEQKMDEPYQQLHVVASILRTLGMKRTLLGPAMF
jgi:F0F1-type ATP synthase delta subunit